MTAKHLKGVYNLNPTNMVMKQGSEQYRREQQKGMKGRYDQTNMHPDDERADFETEGGVEEQVHHMDHPMMQTRHSHKRNEKHADGRKHEDHHHAVRKLKGY